jgi:Zn-dependent M16 (insulinase) family peptidase
MAMIDSGLGEDLVSSGLADYLRQMYFGAGLKGVAPENVERVEPMILSALEEIADAGLDPKAVAAALNTIEFSLRERNSGGFPRGLVLMYQALSGWVYGWDPIDRLAFQQPLAALKGCLSEDRSYLEGLLRTHLLENPHRLTAIISPDPEAGSELIQREEDRLAGYKSSLSQPELEELLLRNEKLKEFQEAPDSPEALAAIPSLRLNDLGKENQLIPVEYSTISDVEHLSHDLFTDGIVYLDLAFDLRRLPREDLPYVPLLSRAFLEMGTRKEDFVSLTQRIGQHTGGIGVRLFTSEIHGEDEGTGWLIIRAKAVIEKSTELLAILEDILLQPRLDDQERFRQILVEEKASLEASMLRAGREIVDSRLRSRFSDAAWAREQMSGVDYLSFIRSLVTRFDTDWESVSARLDQVRLRLLDRAGIKVNITMPDSVSSSVRDRVTALLDQIPRTSPNRFSWLRTDGDHAEGLVIPTQVNYVGKAAGLYSLGYRFDGSIHVILNFLRTTWLWDKVRVQGGAYGASALFGRQSGVLTLASYRDPNLLGTLEIYDRSGSYLSDTQISSDELRKNIIGAIGTIDAYRLPDAKGYLSLVRHLTRESDEARQLSREQVLGTSLSDFRRFSEVLEEFARRGQVAVVGSAAAFDEAQRERPDFFKLVDLI